MAWQGRAGLKPTNHTLATTHSTAAAVHALLHSFIIVFQANWSPFVLPCQTSQDKSIINMQFVGKVISSVSEFYKDINPATLSGAIDVVVVEDVHTGELACSPFHVRFGKLQLLRPQEKAVELCINGEPLGERLRMKVGEAGETFFVLPRQGDGVEAEYLTSPLVSAQTPVPIEVRSSQARVRLLC